jgi:hypothetical protein
MKLPAVAIAAAFAGGILLGLRSALAQHAASRGFLLTLLVCCAVSLLAGIFFAARNYLRAAGVISVCSWGLLGSFGSCTSQESLRSDHLLRRIGGGEINLRSPLRWCGDLSNQPSHLRSGYTVAIAMTSVEVDGILSPVTAGLRLGFTPQEKYPEFRRPTQATRSPC